MKREFETFNLLKVLPIMFYSIYYAIYTVPNKVSCHSNHVIAADKNY